MSYNANATDVMGLMEKEEKPRPLIEIHGTKQDLIVVIKDGVTIKKAKSLLAKEIAKAKEFFKDAVISIGFESRTLKPPEVRSVRTLSKEYNFLFRPLPVDYKEQMGKANALLISKTLRSGQKIEFNGNIVILGDVHPGSEVIASGNIIIWGTARGVLHAGAAGNEKAMICAITLKPSQLRIASFVAIDQETNNDESIPEIAYIHDGGIHSESWNMKSFVKMGISLEE